MPFRKLLLALVAVAAGSGATLLAAQGQNTAGSTAIAHPQLWPSAASPATLSDPQTEAQIDRLVGRMTIEEKVGQMIQADISAITPADLARYPLGSILAGGNSGPYGNERSDAAEWRRLVGEFRAASLKTGQGVPILFGIDAVHGHSNLPGATIFPHNVGLGAAHDPALIRRIGAATAAEVAGSGIEWTFAPTLAAPQNGRWGRSYEGYSSDPRLVASYAGEMVLGLQGALTPGRPVSSHNVAASAKHFLADGGTFDGRDQGDARISERDLVRQHAAGYPPAIRAGALTVMVSFSSWNGAKNHGNASLITGVLKRRMGFGGLVVGDWNGHGQVAGCSNTHCPQAINAGLDLFMAPDSWRELFDATVADVRAGRIPISRVDDAVRRILRVKFKLGLMGPNPVVRGDDSAIGSPEHLALAREAVAKSLVLLKNNGSVLPIRPGAKVLIAGPGADSMAMQAGGWTITWQGTDTTAADFPNGQTIGRALVDAVKANGGTAELSPDGTWQGKPDVAIVVVGEQPYAEFQGDIPNLAFAAKYGEEQLVASLKAKGVPVVTIFLSGRPLFVGKLLNLSDAFVAAWLPGTQGQGIADVLVARRGGKPLRDFTGRLAFAWPDDALSPIKHPLFPLGYGLSYRRAGRLDPVSENPRIDPGAAVNETVFIAHGKSPAPWHLSLDSAVSTRSVDLLAQEDASQFTWSGNGAMAIDGPAANLTSRASEGFALVLDWRIDSFPAGQIRLALGGGAIDLTSLVSSAPAGRRISTAIPLGCFERAGANLAAVTTPLKLYGSKGLALTLRTARIEQVIQSPACP
jgi:beta-glucosidase